MLGLEYRADRLCKHSHVQLRYGPNTSFIVFLAYNIIYLYVGYYYFSFVISTMILPLYAVDSATQMNYRWIFIGGQNFHVHTESTMVTRRNMGCIQFYSLYSTSISYSLILCICYTSKTIDPLNERTKGFHTRVLELGSIEDFGGVC